MYGSPLTSREDIIRWHVWNGNQLYRNIKSPDLDLLFHIYYLISLSFDPNNFLLCIYDFVPQNDDLKSQNYDQIRSHKDKKSQNSDSQNYKILASQI